MVGKIWRVSLCGQAETWLGLTTFSKVEEKKDEKNVQFGKERIVIMVKAMDKTGPDKVHCDIKEVSAIKEQLQALP